MNPIHCHIIHQIDNRVRFHVPEFKLETALTDQLENMLLHTDGISSVRLNLACSSLIVYFDPAIWSPVKLESFLNNLDDQELQSVPIRDNHQVISDEETQNTNKELIYSALAFLTGWFMGPTALPLTALLLYAGTKSMFKRAYYILTRQNSLNVDVLDASATTILTLQGQLPTAAFMVWFVNLADYIRNATVAHSQKAISEMLEFQEKTAWLVNEDKRKQIPINEVQKGDMLVVYPGEMVPVDGSVISGFATVDQRALTGESKPISKKIGDVIYAGTVVIEGKVYFKAEHLSDDTEMAKIVRLVQNAPTHDTRVQNYAEKWANKLVPYSFAGAGTAAIIERSFRRTASILIIDYGTGIRIAAPTTILATMTKAAHNGILIKGGRHIEMLAGIDAVVLDKTGTLTTGIPEIKEIITYKNGDIHSTDEILALAAAAEQRLHHPSAEAIVSEAKKRGLVIPNRKTSDYTIGSGIEASVNGYTVHVGNYNYLKKKQIELQPVTKQDLHVIEEQILSPLLVACDGEVIGILGLEDPIHPEAAQTIKNLRAIGIKEIVMLTGDQEFVAKKVANSLGITRYISKAQPEQKMNIVKQLQKQGYKVAVVGDGINDSPALAQADVGIAVHNSTDVAKEIAHVVLHDNDLNKIYKAILVSREGMDLIEQNWKLISWPNTLALGLVFTGLIGPVASTVISNGSAIIAAMNALRPIWNTQIEVKAEPL
ncbi:MAG TPA: heavy metal translocating P-type ATPase [Balneolales bacterium]|nr:heavy metal translocating P-type ATPase [Balneolales bacterium]